MKEIIMHKNNRMCQVSCQYAKNGIGWIVNKPTLDGYGTEFQVFTDKEKALKFLKSKNKQDGLM